MNQIDIPLLRESATFARRLVEAAQTFGESRYHFHQRVNWSYRYSDVFYACEAERFQANPIAYIEGDVDGAQKLNDVYTQKLSIKQIANVTAKVIVHTLFALLGSLSTRRTTEVTIYRKAYVDDIELVYDPSQVSVLRAVYPFPINLRRQWRYLSFLVQEGYNFTLAGNLYGIRDFWRFLTLRNVHSLMKLESRAQLRHARKVIGLGIRTVQLSDEFDIGSLVFSRTLARSQVHVINSAHGVGKYFPVHAYQTFFVLTQRQRQYYVATRNCNYQIRKLNDRYHMQPTNALRQGYDVVFLSQSFGGVGGLINLNEAILVERLCGEFQGEEAVRLHYKPHPNHSLPSPPKGFSLLKDISKINGSPNTLFCSFFSSCQIDPFFKGLKLLIRCNLIHPEISFDDSEVIVDMDALVSNIRELVKGSVAGPNHTVMNSSQYEI